MTDELITPENLSKELLSSVLNAAFMDLSYDDEGDIRVQEDISCWVLPGVESKDRIKFLAMFRFEPDASEVARLECINKINQGYFLVKAVVGDNDNLSFEYDMFVAGGITKKAFVLALKRFCSIPRSAIADHGTGIIA